MKKHLLCLLLAASCFSQEFWVLGKSYLLNHENGKTHLLTGHTADSWGYDERNCRLWITENNVLYSLHRKKRSYRGEARKILSDIKESFLTLGLDGKLELRNNEGIVMRTYPTPWTTLPIAIAQSNKLNFVLLESGNNLSLHTYDSEFKLLTVAQIVQNRDMWNTPKLIVDESTDSVWIGYTVTQPWTLYAPAIEKRNFKGELLYKKEWKERGILFDACLERTGNLLVSRDIPSNSGYTVPVHSFLESISANKNPETVFAHRENLFMDSLSCQTNNITFISRSIFGSDGSTVEFWDKTPQKFSKTITKLPDPAWKIYACPVN